LGLIERYGFLLGHDGEKKRGRQKVWAEKSWSGES
jgi:hypothetical protein